MIALKVVRKESVADFICEDSKCELCAVDLKRTAAYGENFCLFIVKTRQTEVASKKEMKEALPQKSRAAVTFSAEVATVKNQSER